MGGKVRAEAPAGFLQLVAGLGGSPERVLAAAGLSAADLADPEHPIEIETVMRLADAAARALGDDHLGLHAGDLVDLGLFGTLLYAVFNAPTVGAALYNLEHYARSHLRGPRISVRIHGGEVQLELVLFQEAKERLDVAGVSVLDRREARKRRLPVRRLAE